MPKEYERPGMFARQPPAHNRTVSLPVSPTDDPYRHWKKWDEERRRTQVDEAQMGEQAHLSPLTIDQVSSSAGAGGLQYLSSAAYTGPVDWHQASGLTTVQPCRPAAAEEPLHVSQAVYADPSQQVKPSSNAQQSSQVSNNVTQPGGRPCLRRVEVLPPVAAPFPSPPAVQPDPSAVAPTGNLQAEDDGQKPPAVSSELFRHTQSAKKTRRSSHIINGVLHSDSTASLPAEQPRQWYIRNHDGPVPPDEPCSENHQPAESTNPEPQADTEIQTDTESQSATKNLTPEVNHKYPSTLMPAPRGDRRQLLPSSLVTTPGEPFVQAEDRYVQPGCHDAAAYHPKLHINMQAQHPPAVAPTEEPSPSSPPVPTGRLSARSYSLRYGNRPDSNPSAGGETGLASIAELDAEPQNPVEPGVEVAESGLTPLAQLEAAIASYFSPMVLEGSERPNVVQPLPSRESAGYGLTHLYNMLAALGHEPYVISDEKEVVEIESPKPVAKWYKHFANERAWMFEDVAEEYKKLCGTEHDVKSESSKKS